MNGLVHRFGERRRGFLSGALEARVILRKYRRAQDLDGQSANRQQRPPALARQQSGDDRRECGDFCATRVAPKGGAAAALVTDSVLKPACVLAYS